MFNSNSVTDAVVYKSEYVGRPNRKFIGLVSFDESNDVTLKSNGTIISVVYAEINKFDQINLSRNAEINKFEEIKETIESDCIVNYDNFERKGVKIKNKYNPFKGIHRIDEFNPPKDIPFEYTIILEPYTISVEKPMSGGMTYKEKVSTKAYVYPEKPEKYAPTLRNYKDDQGRIWNKIPDNYWSVEYPDGSYCKYLPNESGFKICYPDGKVIICNGSDLSLGNGIHLSAGIYNFPQFKKSSGIPIPSNREMKILPSSEKYDYKSLSDNEVEKIIKEEVLPYLVDKTGGNLKIYVEDIGFYQNGKYTSWANKKAAEAKAKDAEKKKQIAYWTKKFGFNPFSKKNSDIVKPGRSFALIKEFYEGWDFILSIDHGSSKCYDMYRNNRNFGYIWVANGIIKSVTWY